MNALSGLVLLLGLALSGTTFAQEQGAGNAEGAPPAEPPAAEAEPPPRPQPPSEADRRASGADDVFIPSEELAADEEAVFPVDI